MSSFFIRYFFTLTQVTIQTITFTFTWVNISRSTFTWVQFLSTLPTSDWFTPHMCGKTYWIHSLLQIVTYECTTAWINGAKPSTIDAWQCFLFDIRDCIKEWLLCFSCPSLSPSPFDWTLRYWVCVCCFVLLYFGCYVMCEKKKKCW